MIDPVEEIWPAAVAGAWLFLSFFATGHVLLKKRDVRAAIGWVGLIWLAPFVGATLYVLFGINRIRRRAAAFGVRTSAGALPSSRGRGATEISPPLLSPSAEAIRAYMARVVPSPLVLGNAVRVLDDGDRAYPAMIEAIDGASRSVGFSTYIFEASEAGRGFIDAFARAHRRGVQVRVLIDAVGSRYSFPPAHRALRRLGVPVARFLPALVSPWFNLRNHRKILVVDGSLAFTGGLNIRESHIVARAGRRATRDTQFEIRGPVVSELIEVFAQDWAFATGEVLAGPPWFDSTAIHAGRIAARAIPDGPDVDLEALRWTLLGAIGCAQRTIRIVTPYFLPDPDIATALNVAALRGVDVHIVVPERGNLRFVQWAMWADLLAVLGHGCRVYATPAPFDHSKLMIVDGVWSLFGSANWDARSLRINFEVVVEAYDATLARALDLRIEARIATAREVTREELEQRSVPLRLRDGLARLLSPYF